MEQDKTRHALPSSSATSNSFAYSFVCVFVQAIIFDLDFQVSCVVMAIACNFAVKARTCKIHFREREQEISGDYKISFGTTERSINTKCWLGNLEKPKNCFSFGCRKKMKLFFVVVVSITLAGLLAGW